MTTLPYTHVRQNFKAVMQQVCDDNAPLIITRQGGQSVVMIPEDEYRSWQETIHLLSSPKNAERLLQSKKNTQEGIYEQHDLLAI